MSLKDSFRNYIEREDRKLLNLEEALKKNRRNRKYHNFFEGYTEYTVQKSNGKEQIRRVYTADYYRQAGTLAQVVVIRCAYVFLFALAVFCVLTASMDRAAACNYMWYVQIWHAFCLMLLFWILMILCNYITSRRNWTIYDYKQGHNKLLTISMLAIISHIMGALSNFAYMIIFQSNESVRPGLWLLAAGILLLLINRIEYGLTYETIKNNAQTQYAGGVEIK